MCMNPIAKVVLFGEWGCNNPFILCQSCCNGKKVSAADANNRSSAEKYVSCNKSLIH